MKMKQDKYLHLDGYTIVEIMVVVIIIGVLATITTASITRIRKQTRLRVAQTELELIAAAVRQLAWDTGKWPTRLKRTDKEDEWEIWDLTTSYAGILNNDKNLFKNWKGPYIANIPNDPWGTPYFFDPDYRTNGIDCVVVGSLGPNRIGRNRYKEDNLFVVLEPGK